MRHTDSSCQCCVLHLRTQVSHEDCGDTLSAVSSDSRNSLPLQYLLNASSSMPLSSVEKKLTHNKVMLLLLGSPPPPLPTTCTTLPQMRLVLLPKGPRSRRKAVGVGCNLVVMVQSLAAVQEDATACVGRLAKPSAVAG